jgi:hypothetical protein
MTFSMRSLFKHKQNTHTIVGPKGANWFRRHKKLAIIIGIILVLIIAGGIGTAFYFANKKPAPAVPAKVVQPVVQPPAPKFYSPLTGELVPDQATTTQAVTAIMIENSPDARPQSGLKSAGVVFEAIAEGGITRFAAIYQQEKPALVGPVRSVRMYYVDWIAAFNASVAHIGGSMAALTEVRNGSYRDIDQFFNSGAYYRASDRYAPHNVYTTFERLDALNAVKGYTASAFTGFTRKDSVASKTPTATSMSVDISSGLFNSAYSYNATTNSYDRSEGGVPHMDRENGQISPRVVIVMTIPERTVLEDGYREQIDVIGSGKAVIFQDGTATQVTWAKASKLDQIKFTDAAGTDVPLARGQTWLTSVPEDGGVTWQ